MKEITDINIIHKHLLEIAIAADKVLSAHDIPFIIAYGSLLGAVRHSGFIPWDDDMDFYIPMDNYNEAWDLLKCELPEPFEVVSYESNPSCTTSFYKIHDKRTLLVDKSSYTPFEKQLGVNIDLFPLIMNMDGHSQNIKKLKRLQKLNQMVYAKDIHDRWHTRILKPILQFLCPISRNAIRDKIIGYKDMFGKGNDTFSYLANFYEKEVIPQKYITPYKRISFEGYDFLAPEDYDGYLKYYFGDYMQLPPENKRIWHADGVYLR